MPLTTAMSVDCSNRPTAREMVFRPQNQWFEETDNVFVDAMETDSVSVGAVLAFPMCLNINVVFNRYCRFFFMLVIVYDSVCRLH